MKKNYLAFDLGASSGRAILGTLENDKLDLQEVHRFVNGHKKINNELFWDYPTLVNELKTGLKKALEITKDIASIGIDTWGVDYVLFDNETKKMRTLPYHYRDERTNKQIVEEVFSKISKSDLYKRTGLQFMSLNTLYQLYAHNKMKPEELKNSQFLHMPDALGFELGGDFVTEYTDASTSNLLNPITKEWDYELIKMLGIPSEIFPKIVPPCTVAGALSKELQKELNISAIPIVKVGSHDTASAIGAIPATVNQKFAYISCGTWALLGVELDKPLLNEEAQTFTNEGGLNDKIRYLTNIMGCWLLQESKRDFESKGKAISFQEMSEMAEKATGYKYFIDPNNALFAPPENMLERINQYCQETKQGENLSDSEIIRAIYDSLALCFRDKLEQLEKLQNTNYTVLNIIGGGTKDELLMQFTANAINRDVVAGPVEATAIGNILAQAMALNDVVDLNKVREIVRNSFDLKVFSPQKEEVAKFNQAYNIYKTIVKDN